MPIGILFESDEWSLHHLASEIRRRGVECHLIDLREEVSFPSLLDYDLLVSRVFASSVFRENQRALDQMAQLIPYLEEHAVPLLNPGSAHFYEISKVLSTQALAEHGIPVPQVYGGGLPQEILALDGLRFPCIVKPNCGGRTNFTYLLHSHRELESAMADAPSLPFLAQEYIHPQYGFLTRIEVIGGVCRLILKRSVTESGLSAYSLGSTYEGYDDCSPKVIAGVEAAVARLSILCGSLDVIENDQGYFIIDVNSVSNTSEDCIEAFGFDQMSETATYYVEEYRKLSGAIA